MIIFETEQQRGGAEWVIWENFIKNNIFSFNINDKKLMFYNEKFINENFEESDNDKLYNKNSKKEKNKNNIINIFLYI